MNTGVVYEPISENEKVDVEPRNNIKPFSAGVVFFHDDAGLTMINNRETLHLRIVRSDIDCGDVMSFESLRWLVNGNVWLFFVKISETAYELFLEDLRRYLIQYTTDRHLMAKPLSSIRFYLNHDETIGPLHRSHLSPAFDKCNGVDIYVHVKNQSRDEPESKTAPVQIVITGYFLKDLLLPLTAVLVLIGAISFKFGQQF